MKRSTLLVVAGLIAALGSPAMAQEAEADAFANLQLTKTRAEVMAELAQARRDGTINAWSARYVEPVRTNFSRAEVRAQTLAAIRSGEVDAIGREAYDGRWLPRRPAGTVEVLAGTAGAPQAH